MSSRPDEVDPDLENGPGPAGENQPRGEREFDGGQGPDHRQSPAAAATWSIGSWCVAALGAALMLLVAFAYRSAPITAIALAGMIAVSSWLSIIDFREHRLPNRIVGPLALAVTVALFVAGLVEDDLARTARALGFGLAVAAVLLLASLVGGLGMGDVKYGFPMAATVGWFGWDALVITIMVTTLTGAIVAVAVLIGGGGRSQQLPYGPYMALGLVGGLLGSAPW